MFSRRIAYLGLALLLVGVLMLVYGGVSYTRREQLVELGSFEASLGQKVQAPLWGSGALLIAGLVLVAMGLRKR